MPKDSVKVKVDTYMLVDKKWVLEQTRVFDHARSSDRVKLGKHCWWAFRNQRNIVSTPLSPPDPLTD